MHLHVFLLLFLFFFILSLAQLCHHYWPHHGTPHSRVVTLRTTVQRLRHRRAPRLIVPPAASPPPSRRVWSLPLSLSVPGARSKAGGEPRNG
jgi:hypothetical protein